MFNLPSNKKNEEIIRTCSNHLSTIHSFTIFFLLSFPRLVRFIEHRCARFFHIITISIQRFVHEQLLLQLKHAHLTKRKSLTLSITIMHKSLYCSYSNPFFVFCLIMKKIRSFFA